MGVCSYNSRTDCCRNVSYSRVLRVPCKTGYQAFINIIFTPLSLIQLSTSDSKMIMAGYQMEIDRYDLIINNGAITDLDMLQVYISNNGMIHTVLFPCVAFIVTGIGVLMTPSIADAIVQGSSAHIMSKAKVEAQQ